MICENVDDLAEMAFQSLPLRLRIVGRARVRDIVDETIYEWPVRPLAAAPDAAHAEDVFRVLPEQVQSSYLGRYGEKEYGFVILSVILVAAISAIVQVLIKWWLEKKLNRELMESWHHECRAARARDNAADGEDSEQRSGDE